MCAGCEETLWGNVLYDYQTLLTGILAVLVALVTGGLLWSQIRADHQRFEEQRRRRAMALRSRMPLDLDAIGSYAEAYWDWVWPTGQREPGSRIYRAPPPPPAEAIRSLSEIVEYMDPESASFLAQLLAQCHINANRALNDGFDDDFIMRSAVIMRWMADQGYDYAWLRAASYVVIASDERLVASFAPLVAYNRKRNSEDVEAVIKRLLPSVRSEAEAIIAVVALARRNGWA